MKSHTTSTRVRRSVVLPSQLVEKARAAAPPEIRDNLNRLVVVALEEFAAARERRAFENAMETMARDPEVVSESARITRDFRFAEGDGLPDGPQG